MDPRAAKLALARQKLKCHQEKKLISGSTEYNSDECQQQTMEREQHIPITKPDNGENSPEINLPLVKESYQNPTDLNVTEILISNKRNLEIQVSELQTKLSQLEKNYVGLVEDKNKCKLQINKLEQELKICNDNLIMASNEIINKDKIITELNKKNLMIVDDNNNLQEQLELTKSMLSDKETENSSLQSNLRKLQDQLDIAQLQLQQLTSGSTGQLAKPNSYSKDEADVLAQKIFSLEEQLKASHKEREQINSHYDHYVRELNDQLKIAINRNTELTKEVQNLSSRESSLIDQISDMEIHLQKIKQQPIEQHSLNNDEMSELQINYTDLQAKFLATCNELENLQRKYGENEMKLKELLEAKNSDCDHENISMSKLNADITSDKIAAQRATEQNRKLKTDLQELEEAFVKISRDKLDLTEKITAEKYLNRELTIKLAEIEDKAKDMHKKLTAKDEEMIRLQQLCSEQEKELKNFSEHLESMKNKNDTSLDTSNSNEGHLHNLNKDPIDAECHKTDTEYLISKPEDEHTKCIKTDHISDSLKIPKEDAMSKLQERFLKIMSEVADLSDEKHRLEHIILQLQNETDTICEYVALYQQQRSLLKKRDEERSAQIKIFQMQCELLKNQLEELSSIIVRLAQDTELASYFKVESKQNDLTKVLNLLNNLKSNTLINPHRASSELNHFYPCSCCSGKLIDV